MSPKFLLLGMRSETNFPPSLSLYLSLSLSLSLSLRPLYSDVFRKV